MSAKQSMGALRRAPRVVIRASVLGGALLGLIGFGGSQTLAFPVPANGCDAVNAGGFTAFSDASQPGTELKIAGFAVGDSITFNITVVPGSGHPRWSIGAGSDDLDIATSEVSGTQVYTVTGNLVGGQADTTLSQLVATK